MTDIWVISDTHFGHANILKKKPDGSPIRPFFNSVDEMNARMVHLWNETIKPQDKVYHLGDVAFGQKTLDDIMPQLHGKKRLIMGNHDGIDVRVYRKYFKRIASWRRLTVDEVKLYLCHYPLHETALNNRHTEEKGIIGVCVHGHIHDRPSPSPAHINVCVERTNYMPVHIDELVKIARGQHKHGLVNLSPLGQDRQPL